MQSAPAVAGGARVRRAAAGSAALHHFDRARFSGCRRNLTATITAIVTISVPNRNVPRPAYSAARLRLLEGEIADQGKGRRPQAGTEDAVGRERSVAHPRAPGDERRQRPRDPTNRPIRIVLPPWREK